MVIPARCSVAVPRRAPLPVELVGRSLFPLMAMLLLALVPLLGPGWVLLATFGWWRLVARIG